MKRDLSALDFAKNNNLLNMLTEAVIQLSASRGVSQALRIIWVSN